MRIQFLYKIKELLLLLFMKVIWSNVRSHLPVIIQISISLFSPLLTKENKNNLLVMNCCIRWPEFTVTNLMAGEVPYATAGTVLPHVRLHIIVAKHDSHPSCSKASNRLTKGSYKPRPGCTVLYEQSDWKKHLILY